MEYKGYKAKIVYEPELDVLYGRVLNTRDVITFQAKTTDDLKPAMEEAIDEYVQFCEEVGREPEKSYSGKFVVRVLPKLHRRLAELAMGKGISLNKAAILALEAFVTQEAEKGALSPELLPAPAAHVSLSGQPPTLADLAELEQALLRKKEEERLRKLGAEVSLLSEVYEEK